MAKANAVIPPMNCAMRYINSSQSLSNENFLLDICSGIKVKYSAKVNKGFKWGLEKAPNASIKAMRLVPSMKGSTLLTITGDRKMISNRKNVPRSSDMASAINPPMAISLDLETFKDSFIERINKKLNTI